MNFSGVRSVEEAKAVLDWPTYREFWAWALWKQRIIAQPYRKRRKAA